MKTYTVEFISHTRKGQELLEEWQLTRMGLIRQDYQDIITNLIYFAELSRRHAFLSARIHCNGKKAFTIRCNTESNSEGIWSTIEVAKPREKYTCLRRIRICNHRSEVAV